MLFDDVEQIRFPLDLLIEFQQEEKKLMKMKSVVPLLALLLCLAHTGNVVIGNGNCVSGQNNFIDHSDGNDVRGHDNRLTQSFKNQIIGDMNKFFQTNNIQFRGNGQIYSNGQHNTPKPSRQGRSKEQNIKEKSQRGQGEDSQQKCGTPSSRSNESNLSREHNRR